MIGVERIIISWFPRPFLPFNPININIRYFYNVCVLCKIFYTYIGIVLFKKVLGFEFKIKFNLTIFQLDATYSVYYITVGSSTCFGC